MTDTSPTQNFTEKRRLVRKFVYRIFTECLEAGADKILLRGDNQTLLATLRRDRTDVKTFTLKPQWLSWLCEWLEERQAFFVEGYVLEADRSSKQYPAALRVGGEVVTFQVSQSLALSGATSLTISELKVLSDESVLRLMGFDDGSGNVYSRFLNESRGVLLASSPNPLSIRATIGALLALTEATYLGDLDSVNAGDLEVQANSSLVLISTISSDPIEAALQFTRKRLLTPSIQIAGLFTQGVVPQVCAQCARKTVFDKNAIAEFPEGIRPSSDATYSVGRGCPRCHHTGYFGYIGLQSVVLGTEKMNSALKGGALQGKLVDIAYEQGCRPLLADGLAKVAEGKVTLEGLSTVVKSMPAAYLPYYCGRNRAEVIETGPLAIGDSFLKEGKDVPRPLQGRAAFFGSSAIEEEFMIAPKRNKPLLFVVEDDPDQRSVLQIILEGANYEVRVAENGKEALKLLERETPNLILCDLMMPEMDGSQLVSHIRSKDRYQKVPILILTVVSDAEKEYSLLDLGADDYCEKNIRRKILLKRVENLLKRSEGLPLGSHP